jgi:two-component system chemotaxis sensor kinase CheA
VSAPEEARATPAKTECGPDGKDAPCYKAKLFFEENCQMEGLRAFGVVQGLKNICGSIATVPGDLEAESASEAIRKDGLCIFAGARESG